MAVGAGGVVVDVLCIMFLSVVVSETADEPTVASEETSEETRTSVCSLVFGSEETVEETRSTAAVSLDSSPIEEDVVETSLCPVAVLASVLNCGMFLADELSDTSVDRALVNTAGLEETTWLPFKAENSVTEVEASGLKSVISDLLV